MERHDAVATFFVRGDHISAYPDVHAASLAAGHDLGNHTWDHPDLARYAQDGVADQLERTSRAIKSVAGRRPTLFRPPYGHLAGSSLIAAGEAGLTTVLWSTQMHDNAWVAHPERVLPDVRKLISTGDIVLAHDSGSNDRLLAIDHLDGILTNLREDGYGLVTVSDLLRTTPRR